MQRASNRTRAGRFRPFFAPGWGIFASALSACGAPPDSAPEATASISEDLYLRGTRWPNGVVPVCWDTTTSERSDFPVRSTLVRKLVNASWPVYAHVYFTGWGICGTNLNGRVRVTIDESPGGNAGGFGYTAGTRTMVLGTNHPDFGGGMPIHEFGHELGFAHEMARPDFPDEGSCSEADFVGGDTLGTTADPQSIMAATGYCQHNSQLSAQDRTGVRNAYGAPDCERRTESHTDPNTGVSWSTVWYCGNRSGAAMYAGASTSTLIGWMDSSTSWFVCYVRGAQHSGGNNVWYYSQGDRSSAGQSARKAWGYMPAVNVWTDVDPHPNIPICCGGRSCNPDTEFCSAGTRCCPVDRCAPGCPC